MYIDLLGVYFGKKEGWLPLKEDYNKIIVVMSGFVSSWTLLGSTYPGSLLTLALA